MKNRIRKTFAMLFIVITMTAFFTFETNAIDLGYSGSSTSNFTGASATTSGYTISYSAASSNICGYRFSIVSSNGLPKSGTRVLNVYKTDLSIGDTAYFSGQRFISSANVAANKKQLANGTYVYSTTTTQGCDCYSTAAGFYSTIPQAPGSIGDWLKDSTNGFQNLQRIYYYCGSNISNATESDYILTEPIFWVKLANVRTAATATELAIYGAAVSGGDAYNGGNGNLYNAGSTTLWNLMNYINREFPNALYVSTNTDVYSTVSVISSGRYTYSQIIQYGYGCSILTVRNVVPIKRVYIAYHPNGGTTTYPLNENGYVMMNGTPYFHSLTHGTNDDTYDASTLGLTKVGYTFKGWQILGSSVILNQDTEYASTQYTYYIDSSKTTANTQTVYCHLFAVWEKNSYTNGISHWAWGFNGNGNNTGGTAFHLLDTTYTKYYGDNFSLDASNAYIIPNGFWLENDYGSSSFTGVWSDYPFGTTIAQGASGIWVEYDYHPTTYNITYDLNGGTNNSSNPSTYNVLYGVTLNNPTKENAEFLGWDLQYKKDVTLPVTSNNWNYNIVLNGIQPNVTYNVTIDSAKMLSGTSEYFTCLLYDFTSLTELAREDVLLGDNVSFSISCPSYSNPNNYVGLLLYSGMVGNTSGKSTEYDNIVIQYSADGVNEGCNSYFTDTNNLYTELEKRVIGDITFIANWREDEKSEIIILPIEPNAPYREKTEVVSSFWIINPDNIDYTGTSGLKIAYEVYDLEGRILAEEIKSFVCPKEEKNLSYFNWYIPEGYRDKILTVNARIVDDAREYFYINKSYKIEPYVVCKTPDTTYMEEKPNSFINTSVLEDENLNARWWEWEYNGNTFVKKEYAVGCSLNNITLSAPNSPTAYIKDGKLNLKSGYGFECRFDEFLSNVAGFNLNSVRCATGSQYQYVLFPEFNYEYGIDTSRSIEIDDEGKNAFVIADTNHRQHFVPIYFPDGEYKFKIVLSDCWTPAGMLKTTEVVKINIDGNMYDDWYINHAR